MFNISKKNLIIISIVSFLLILSYFCLSFYIADLFLNESMRSLPFSTTPKDNPVIHSVCEGSFTDALNNYLCFIDNLFETQLMILYMTPICLCIVIYFFIMIRVYNFVYVYFKIENKYALKFLVVSKKMVYLNYIYMALIIVVSILIDLKFMFYN